jgi:hypothetical protein
VTDWWSIGVSGVSLAVSLGVAIYTVGAPRRHQLADRDREEKARLESAIAAAELGAYELQSAFWLMDAHFRSVALAGQTPNPDCSLYMRQFETRAAVLERFAGENLPNPVLEHVVAVRGLLIEARNHMRQWSGIVGGQHQVLAGLLSIRHFADIQHEENSRLSLAYLGRPGVPSQPAPQV